MPPNHRFYHDWSPERFKKWAARIGKDTELLINYILQSRPHPEQAFKVCLGILNMEKKYGAAALNLTCRYAWNKDRYSFKYIKSNIETVKIQMEKENEEQELWHIPQSHQNIRGNSYQ